VAGALATVSRFAGREVLVCQYHRVARLLHWAAAKTGIKAHGNVQLAAALVMRADFRRRVLAA